MLLRKERTFRKEFNMTETVITSFISAGAAIFICMVNNFFQSKAAEEVQAKTVEMIEFRLKQLEEAQNKHNNLITRTFELEKSEEVFKEKIAVVNHRIDDLEEFHK